MSAELQARLEVESWHTRLLLPGQRVGMNVVDDVPFHVSVRRTPEEKLAALRARASEMLAEHGWRQLGEWAKADPGAAYEAWTTSVEAVD